MSDTSHFCPDFHKAIELIGRRWSGAIVRELLGGTTRFTDLHDAIPDISDRMLCTRLRELEAEGVVSRRIYSDTPGRVEYHLTDKGLALRGVVAAIGDWADKWMACGESGAKADAASWSKEM